MFSSFQIFISEYFIVSDRLIALKKEEFRGLRGPKFVLYIILLICISHNVINSPELSNILQLD